MFARIKLNLNAFGNGSTTINIPLSLDYQNVDTNDVVKRLFVDVEVEKAINPIEDYDKARFTPVDENSKAIRNVNYTVSVLDGSSLLLNTTYATLGFTNEDIQIKKNSFKESYLYLKFYDSDIALSQSEVTDTTLYCFLSESDLVPIGATIGLQGQPKPANQIPVRFTLSNPVTNPRGFSEGYHMYDYKSSYRLGVPNHLYMRATLVNAKTGKSTNLMTEPKAFGIDKLVKKIYTRYILTRTTTGFYYMIDPIYSKNVKFAQSTNGYDVNVALYQIQAL